MLTMQAIADAYAKAPLYQAAAVPSYRALAHRTTQLYAKVARYVNVVETAASEPYESATAMFADIDERRRLIISTANSEHEVFTHRENFEFRAVHDYFGHYAAKSDFTWEGEVQACKEHGDALMRFAVPPHSLQSMMASDAFPAFFTECYGQVAYALRTGAFGPQKIALLDVF